MMQCTAARRSFVRGVASKVPAAESIPIRNYGPRTVDCVQGARLGGLLQAAQRVGDERDAAIRELPHVRPQLLLPA